MVKAVDTLKALGWPRRREPVTEPDCRGKESFDGYIDADSVFSRMLKAGRINIEIYRCRTCQKWHIGGRAPRPRQ